VISLPLPLYASPYIPNEGGEVLERLPSRNDPGQQEVRRLRTILTANPHDAAAAVSLGRRYIEMWRDGGDPRYLGYAQAALGAWWNLPRPPEAVQVMRAVLRQSTHQFSGALADLDSVLKEDPNNAQAWLTRSSIEQVLGQYQQAKLSCAHLYGRANGLVSQACLYSVTSLNGEADKSYQRLSSAISTSRTPDRGVRLWVLTLLAEMASRRGDDVAAQAHYSEAMASGEPDNYLLASYADFLLRQEKAEQVRLMLQSRLQVDALLLRYALALKALHAADTPKYVDALRQRFEAAQMRGDTIHQREQAIYELDLANAPVKALDVAQRNWAIQKEPTDTLVLLRAAAVNENRAAARPVLEWIKSVRLEDRQLDPLIRTLGGLPQ
jgi:hypothetical protein